MNEEEKRHLAGAIRNNMTAPGAIFTALPGLELTYQDGSLCKVGHGPDNQVHRVPIADAHDIYDKSDDQIWKLIMGGK